MSPHRPTHVIAIGSSAGGLEALTEFFNHLPALEAVAVVVAQHLSPTYKSHLVELLSRETQLLVQEITEGLALVAGRVYIIPPDAEATLDNGQFFLHPPASSVGPKPSASLLFQSVAQQPDIHTVAIVLSGTGSDGASGLETVKMAGGWCFAQTPEDARYNGMPLAAIHSGYVDEVLPPREMGPRIQALIQAPETLASISEPLETPSSGTFRDILDLLTDKTGTDFSNYKSSTITRRLEKRILALNQSTQEEYLRGLKANPDELDELFKSMLIGVTRFFRDPEVFEAFDTHLQALIQRKSEGEPLRIWVPGCATGEEVYSLAMLVQEALGTLQRSLQVQIFATDISDSSLAFARQAIYGEAQLQGLPDRFRQKYFQAYGEDRYQLSKSLRSMVLFSRHDITVNPPFLKLDVISCRNLLIYFNNHLQKHILPTFHYALNPEGLLLLGKSETIGAFGDSFAVLNNRLKIFRRRSVSRPPVFHHRHFQPVVVSRSMRYPVSIREERTLQDLAQTTLAESFPHAYVVVNENLDLLHVSGDVSAYLQLASGRMSTHILKLCHEELQLEMRSVCTQALKSRAGVLGRFHRWPQADSSQLLRLRAQPVLTSEENHELLLVIFETLELEAQFVPVQAPDDSAYEGLKIQQLEHELSVTREYLQSFVEELETSNEELQALNEELQSANEELQSTNEELETANEELQSTNEEMQVAYAELRTANEVLERKDRVLSQTQQNTQAILENTPQGFMLIDRDYHVVAFNTLAQSQHQKHFKRSLREKLPIIDAFDSEILKQLLPLMQKTLQQKSPCAHQLKLEDEQQTYWYRYAWLPVIQNDEAVGITLSMQDITEVVNTHQALKRSNALIDSVFDATSTGICVTDEKGCFIKVNQGYCLIYGYTAEELIGQHFTLMVLPEQKAAASAMHDDFIAGAEEIPGEWQVQRKDGQIIDIFASARLLINPDGSRYKVTTVRDISESKKYQNLLSDTQQAVGVGGWEFDVLNHTLHWTPEVYAIHGLPVGSPVDLDLAYSYYPEEVRYQVELAVNTALEAGTPFDMELQFLRHDEQTIWVRATCKPIRIYNKTVKLFGTFQDITERKQAEEEKSRLIHELTEKNEDLKQFTYIISHNLRAPVANLLGLTQLLRLQPEEGSHVLASIESSAMHLDEVIQDLNHILSVRRQDQQTLYETVNLSYEIKSLLSALQRELDDLGTEVELDLKVTQLLTIRSYYQSILYNLITNAVKYASPERHLRLAIRTWQENEVIYLSVEDNGLGLNAEGLQEQLFRLYKRFHALIPGKGLGLYLVKTQAEVLGGGVSVKSEENKGACFTVYVKAHRV